VRPLGSTIKDLKRYKSLWAGLIRDAALARPDGAPATTSSHLKEVRSFGANPGALRMFSYVPEVFKESLPLVVVLHGCKQTAASYDRGAGWSQLADRYGFALVLPQQQRSNNPNNCFNWFLPGDIKRGLGEAHSIRQMIASMIADQDIDPRRIFVTGLSAGGAMTSVMLAAYPDLFAGGAIIAGLPYGSAGNVQEAFEAMFQSPSRPKEAWGNLVRAASPHSGPWPRVSIWHGAADATVIPQNAAEIAKQWADVHGLQSNPTERSVVDGFPRAVWRNQAGEEVIESYAITGMAHGTPLAPGDAEGQAGVAGAFLLDVGISSSYHIAKFWEIASKEVSRGKVSRPEPVRNEIIETYGTSSSHPSVYAQDVGGIITRALQAAGLMKRPD
jgi:poly(hydroxyalkanoate) depolymerase family esterase